MIKTNGAEKNKSVSNSWWRWTTTRIFNL